MTLLCFAITEARNSLSCCSPMTFLAPITAGAKIPSCQAARVSFFSFFDAFSAVGFGSGVVGTTTPETALIGAALLATFDAAYQSFFAGSGFPETNALGPP